MAASQRARFVKGDGPNRSERFEVGAALYQDAVARGARNGRNHRDGNRDHQTAGTRNRKHDQCAIEPFSEITAEQWWQNGKQNRQGEHRGRVRCAEAISKALGAALTRLRLFNLVDDTREHRVRVFLRNPDLQCPIAIKSAAEDARAARNFDRHRLGGYKL